MARVVQIASERLDPDPLPATTSEEDVGHTEYEHLRASTIRSSQQAIRIKIVYLCLVGGERRGERRRVGSHARAGSSTCS
jgi:hypothetical protein